MYPLPSSTLFPYTTLFRSLLGLYHELLSRLAREGLVRGCGAVCLRGLEPSGLDRKSTRLIQSQSNLVCRLLLEKKKLVEFTRFRPPLPTDADELTEQQLEL